MSSDLLHKLLTDIKYVSYLSLLHFRNPLMLLRLQILVVHTVEQREVRCNSIALDLMTLMVLFLLMSGQKVVLH